MNRRLHRSRTDVAVSGVAGGVAEWLGWDPSLVRILWIIAVPFTGGLALLVYLVMWVVVPEAPIGPGAADGPPGAVASMPRLSGLDPSLVIGGILIVVGALLLLRNVVAIDWDRVWPVVLVAVGAVLLIASLRRGSS